jgi:NAD-dependent deacetylase
MIIGQLIFKISLMYDVMAYFLLAAKEFKIHGNMKLKLVVLSGAGISAESGVATFRGSGGLWEGYDVMEVASPAGWAKDYKLVLEFYNARRRVIEGVDPNLAHKILAEMQEEFDVKIVTQNIDNLHEKAGSKNVLHLHGEITKACCSNNKLEVVEIGYEDIGVGDLSSRGSQLRPFIVWFGEEVPLIPEAAKWVSDADALLIIGTSLEVYPAAGLVNFVNEKCTVYVIDPQDLKSKVVLVNEVVHIQEKATDGVVKLKKMLQKKANI